MYPPPQCQATKTYKGGLTRWAPTIVINGVMGPSIDNSTYSYRGPQVPPFITGFLGPPCSSRDYEANLEMGGWWALKFP